MRIAGAIYMVLGVGHLVTATVISRELVASWLTSGLWSAVPLALTGATPEVLRDVIAFWAGLASFGLPLFLVGMLLWRLARHAVLVPAGVGWILTGWCLVCTVILAPSPFYLGIAGGVLVIVASSRVRASQPAAELTSAL